LRVGRETLEHLGLDPYEAREKADLFKRYNLNMLEATLENFEDTEFRLANLRRARNILSDAIDQDQRRLTGGQREGWRGSIDGKAPDAEPLDSH